MPDLMNDLLSASRRRVGIVMKDGRAYLEVGFGSEGDAWRTLRLPLSDVDLERLRQQLAGTADAHRS